MILNINYFLDGSSYKSITDTVINKTLITFTVKTFNENTKIGDRFEV